MIHHPLRNGTATTLFLAAVMVCTGCVDDMQEAQDGFVSSFDFSTSDHGFVAGFADYPPQHEGQYELIALHAALPDHPEGHSGLYLSGFNHSDDLLMFYKGAIHGLAPDGRYAASVGAEIYTSVPAGCVGVGGSPGEGVWIKVGISAEEPNPDLVNGYLRMNIDVGSQSNGGMEAVVLGNIANGQTCEEPSQWHEKLFDSVSIPQVVQASSNGVAWLFLGVDSGFEGRTEVYFMRAFISLIPVE